MDKTLDGIMLLISELIEFIPDAEKERVTDFYNKIQSIKDVEKEAREIEETRKWRGL